MNGKGNPLTPSLNPEGSATNLGAMGQQGNGATGNQIDLDSTFLQASTPDTTREEELMEELQLILLKMERAKKDTVNATERDTLMRDLRRKKRELISEISELTFKKSFDTYSHKDSDKKKDKKEKDESIENKFKVAKEDLAKLTLQEDNKDK